MIKFRYTERDPCSPDHMQTRFSRPHIKMSYTLQVPVSHENDNGGSKVWVAGYIFCWCQFEDEKLSSCVCKIP